MALVLADRVRETSTTTGTGTFTLAGAVVSYQSFAAVGNTNTTYYTIVNQNAAEWEVGIGTYTSSGTTLARTTVLSSSNAGSAVNFSAGTKDVWGDYPAGKAVTTDTLASPPAIGGTTPAAATFTTLTATGQTSLGGAAGAEGLRVTNTASTVNYVQAAGSLTGAAVVMSAQGSDANIDLTLTPKGTGRVNITTSIKPKVSSAANVTSPLAWNSTSFDQYAITALANALTISADANASPADGQKAIFRFKDNGTARALTWTTGSTNSFRAIGVTLPTTTVVSKIVYVGCVYNVADSRWDAVAVAQEA